MKKFACMLALAAMLCSCAGCGLSNHTAQSTPAASTAETTIPPTGEVTQPTTGPEQGETVPMLSQERMALIEAYWNSKYGSVNRQSFRDPQSGNDGIRYYGSFELTGDDGAARAYDILYIPFPELQVPQPITLRGYEFSSRQSAFALYAFTFYAEKDGGIGMRYATFTPLVDFVDTHWQSQWEGIDDSIIAYAAELHAHYEDMLGKTQTGASRPAGDAYETQRVKAAWLHCFGFLPDFENAQGNHRYYGRYDRCDVFYYANISSTSSTVKIGNEEFINGPFQLRVYKDGCCYYLQDAYASGLISDEVLAKIAQIHNQFETT